MALNFLNNGYFAGSVGIGTQSPTQAKLVVNTTSLVASAFGRDGTDGDVVQIYNGLVGSTKIIALGASGNDGTIYSQFGNLLLQPSAGNVGIGITGPVSKLEVDGSIKVTGITASIGSAPGMSLSYDSGINYINTWNSTPLITSTYNYQAFHISGSEKMRIDTAGNVGIGTTSPGTINGVAFSSVGLHTKFGTLGRTITEGSQWGEYIMNHSGESANRRAKFIQSKAGDINIGSYDDNGTQRLQARLDNNGTFFLGNASTAYQTVFFDSTPGTVYGNGTLQISPLTSPGSGIAQFTTNFADRVGGGTTKHNVRVGGTVTATDFIGGSGAYLPLTAGSGEGLTGQLWFTGTTDANRKIFFTNAGTYAKGSMDAASYGFQVSGSEKLTILSSGNVGIGTTGPRYQLDLAKAQNSSQADYIALGVNNGNTAGTGTALGSGLIWKANYSGYTKRSAGIVQIAQGSFFRSALAFYTNGTANTTTDWSERMRIDMDGNVGIGATDPQQKLHIVDTDGANIILNSNTGAENNGIWMTEGGIATPYVNGAYVHYDSTNNVFKINTGAASLATRFEIARDTGAIKFNNYNSTNNTGTPTYVLGTDASGNVVKVLGGDIPGGGGTVTGTGTTSQIPLWSDGPNGVLGNSIVSQIGTSRISVASSSASLTLGQWDGANNRIESGNRPLFITSYTSPIKLGISGSTTMTIESSNVGIGTTNPSQKLQVDGRIRIPYNSSNSYYFGQDNGSIGYGSMHPFDNGGNYTFDTNYASSVGSYKFKYNGTEIFRLRNTGAFAFGSGGNDYGASGQILKSNGNASPTWIDGSAIPGVPAGSGTVNTIPLWTPDGDTLGNSIITQPTSAEVIVGGKLKVDSTAAGYSSTKIQTGELTSSQAGINILNSTTGYGYILFGDGSGADLYRGQITYKHGDDYMSFNAAGGERMRIDSSGNVMIGNTGAGAKLDVRADTGYVFRTENASGNTFRIEASSGNIYTTGDLYIEDSNKIRLGASSDLQIYHDGTHSFINNLTGDLTIENAGDDLILKAADDLLLYVQGTEIALQAIGNGKVGLRYNNVEKFVTTSTGVSVTGNVLASGYLAGQSSQYNPTGGGTTLATLTNNSASRTNLVISNQTNNAAASAALVLATYGHDYFIKGSSSLGGSQLTLGFNTSNFLTLTSSAATFAGAIAVQGTGDSYFTGDVGIGTTSPNVLGFLETGLNIAAGGSSSTTLQQAGLVISGSSDADDADDFGYLSFTNYQSTLSSDRVAEIRINKGGSNVNTGRFNFYTANGTALNESMVLGETGLLKLSQYGAGTLVSDASGNITVSSGGGAGGPYLPLSAGSGFPLTGDLVINTKIKFGVYSYIGEDLTDTDSLTIASDSTESIFFAHYNQAAATFTTTAEIDPDGNFLLYDGNVGIGTTSPTFKLHVNSTDASDNVAYIHHNNAAQSSGDVLKVRSDAGDNAGSALLNVANNTGSALYVRGDRNVGIGTTSPSKKLHVYSDANEGIFMQGTGGGHWFNFQSGTSNLWSMGAQTGMMGWYNRTTGNVGYKMVIQDGGNVGIGTTSPGQRLEVTGNTYVTGYVQASSAVIGNKVVSSVNYATFGSNSTATGVALSRDWNPGTYPDLIINPAGNVGIGNATPVYKLDVVSAGDGLLSLTGATKPAMIFKVGTAVVGGIQAQANTSLNVSAYGTSSLNLQTVGTTPRLTILTGGNVGIGTITPAAKLDVVGEIRASEGSNYSSILTSGGDTIFANVSTAANNIRIFNGGSERMRITSTGNVGIGVTNPGTNRLQVASAASGPAVKIDNTSATGGNGLEVNGGSSSGGHALKIGDYNGSFKMIVQGTGNVGIGALAPATQLEIFNENDNPATLRLSSDLTDGDLVGAIISFSNDAGGGGVQGRIENVSTEDDTTVFKFYTDNTSSPSMTLFDSGNMTIAGTLTQNSDVRLKENIKPIESALDKVKQMQGVEFNKINSSTKEIGVVAQEIEKIIPELVLEDKEGIKSVAYGNITAVLIEAIKEQQKQIEELKQQLNK